jgi:hypothetical protein
MAHDPSIADQPSVTQVTGDVTVDWMLIVPHVVAPATLQVSYQWETRAPVQIISQPGGAALLAGLVQAAAPGPVHGPVIPTVALTDPSHPDLTRTYTQWQPYPSVIGSRDLIWRMHRFLGMQAADTPAALPNSGPDDSDPAVLVIDDAALGFRACPEHWPPGLRAGKPAPRHIILKMASPLATGALWDHLVAQHADQLTLYCSVDDLRKEYAPVGQPLSWERTASDIVAAIRGRPYLLRAARVIASLGLCGAVLVDRDGACRLIYDPTHQEGDWERRHPGTPTGLGTCLTAALAVAAAAHPDEPGWVRAIVAGLVAGRTLHECRRVLPPAAVGDSLLFPTTTIAPLLSGRATEDRFRVVEIPEQDDWRVIATSGGHRDIASRIVVEGDIAACRDIPVERIGAWSSIDRTEVESMRSVRNIMHEYLAQPARTRPLSLAVFGPPGSGKSFAIKQIARDSLDGAQRIAVLEFNLSQFSAPADFPAALQRVRDCAVEHVLPLVFWDEFDAMRSGHELGWLAQFLAPMQDGIFVEDGIARPIGPAIFIFAGGIHPTLASFKRRAVEIPGAKATDFLSRLRGFVDILGPNPAHPTDDTFVLRRALLLRALLLQKAPGLFQMGQLNIDPGVLRAYLDVTTYVHGARSMESIVDMSALSGKLRYERSALPPQHQLSLHVDAEEFLSLVA